VSAGIRINGFWPITVYHANGFLIPNVISRYDPGSETGLTFNADGSLDIFLQSAQPQTMQSNWLPVPAAPFKLTMRIYWPNASVLKAWTPPP
jgi:hypothetical protein